MTDWFYAQGTTQLGPVSLSSLIDLLRSGALNANDLVWRDGMAEWTPAGQVPELAGAIGGAQPVQPAKAVGYATPVSPGMAPNYGQPYYTAPAGRHLGFSITSMVLGIVSYCCCYFGVLTAITGLIFGIIALNAMKRTGDARGKGMATAGVVLASIYLALFAVLILVGLLNSSHHAFSPSPFRPTPTPTHSWPTNP
jgi:hypothetical protein